MKKYFYIKIISIALIFQVFSFTSYTNDKTSNTHDPKRTYLANDNFALDTEISYAKATRFSSQGNWKETAKIYLKTANRGHPTSQVHLGKLYVHGNGVPQDLVEAYKWFLLSEVNNSVA